MPSATPPAHSPGRSLRLSIRTSAPGPAPPRGSSPEPHGSSETASRASAPTSKAVSFSLDVSAEPGATGGSPSRAMGRLPLKIGASQTPSIPPTDGDLDAGSPPSAKRQCVSLSLAPGVGDATTSPGHGRALRISLGPSLNIRVSQSVSGSTGGQPPAEKPPALSDPPKLAEAVETPVSKPVPEDPGPMPEPPEVPAGSCAAFAAVVAALIDPQLVPYQDAFLVRPAAEQRARITRDRVLSAPPRAIRAAALHAAGYVNGLVAWRAARLARLAAGVDSPDTLTDGERAMLQSPGPRPIPVTVAHIAHTYDFSPFTLGGEEPCRPPTLELDPPGTRPTVSRAQVVNVARAHAVPTFQSDRQILVPSSVVRLEALSLEDLRAHAAEATEARGEMADTAEASVTAEAERSGVDVKPEPLVAAPLGDKALEAAQGFLCALDFVEPTTLFVTHFDLSRALGVIRGYRLLDIYPTMKEGSTFGPQVFTRPEVGPYFGRECGIRQNNEQESEELVSRGFFNRTLRGRRSTIVPFFSAWLAAHLYGDFSRLYWSNLGQACREHTSPQTAEALAVAEALPPRVRAFPPAADEQSELCTEAANSQALKAITPAVVYLVRGWLYALPDDPALFAQFTHTRHGGGGSASRALSRHSTPPAGGRTAGQQALTPPLPGTDRAGASNAVPGAGAASTIGEQAPGLLAAASHAPVVSQRLDHPGVGLTPVMPLLAGLTGIGVPPSELPAAALGSRAGSVAGSAAYNRQMSALRRPLSERAFIEPHTRVLYVPQAGLPRAALDQLAVHRGQGVPMSGSFPLALLPGQPQDAWPHIPDAILEHLESTTSRQPGLDGSGPLVVPPIPHHIWSSVAPEGTFPFQAASASTPASPTGERKI
ncbi:hypothetical protein H696_00952 [Fonticula alba]|uniref:Uncharacterized protein n=1 Tax=Fonticula alba TaxID=691883 RepID=A0A058ZG89_FONAL|nr:hypothetical protein H696_00952 [Fonticula alba]KCV73415.1 hypothetical protein H696_00952 [Fonticula alba]|eukprot:XP_009493116.1 hypothetical protein H696_00952 [Fonticula alba]